MAVCIHSHTFVLPALARQLSLYQYLCVGMHVSIYLPIYLPIYLSIHLSTCSLSLYLSLARTRSRSCRSRSHAHGEASTHTSTEHSLSLQHDISISVELSPCSGPERNELCHEALPILPSKNQGEACWIQVIPCWMCFPVPKAVPKYVWVI